MADQTHKASYSGIESAPNIANSKDAEASGKCTTYVTLIYIVAICGIVGSVAKILLITIEIEELHKAFPLTSTYYLCGLGIAMSGIGIIWEVALLYFVRKRKLAGMQHYVFQALLFVMQACIATVVTGGVYQRDGLFLAMSFTFDVIRSPVQMILVHKFIKSEKLLDDSYYIAAYYKKF